MALQELLARAAGRPDEDRIRRDLEPRIDALAATARALGDDIRRRAPDFDRLVNPEPVSLAAIGAALNPGQAMVSLYVGERWSYVWAIAPHRPPAMARIDAGADALAAMVGRLRLSLEPATVSAGDLPPFDVALAHALYARVLAPVELTWSQARELVVVPHGPLAQLPSPCSRPRRQGPRRRRARRSSRNIARCRSSSAASP